MIKLKKLAAFLLSGAMCVSCAFAFAACDADGTESGSQTGEQTDGGSGDSDAENDNTDAETGNEGTDNKDESGSESSGNTDMENDNTEGGDAAENDGDEGGDNTENNDDESDNVETDDTYYGKTYTVDYSALDYYNYDTLMTDEEKADLLAYNTMVITLTLQEDGTGTCMFTQYGGSMELNISFDYTAVECTQLSYTYTLGNSIKTYTHTFTRDFTGVQFEFSNYVITKITEEYYDYTDQLSSADMAEIGAEYMSGICSYGYDGTDFVVLFAVVDCDSVECYYEEATGNYYYFDEDTGKYYCETSGEYLDQAAASQSDGYTLSYEYIENSAVIGYGALKAAE